MRKIAVLSVQKVDQAPGYDSIVLYNDTDFKQMHRFIIQLPIACNIQDI